MTKSCNRSFGSIFIGPLALFYRPFGPCLCCLKLLKYKMEQVVLFHNEGNLMFKKLNLLILLLLCPLFLLAKTVTIYHTSDVHGFFYPKDGQGGFAALASVIKHGPSNYLLLDGGDFANGTAETRLSKGTKAIELMNALHYDAATIGNHEFDFKDKQLPVLFEQAQFPILAANFFEKGTHNYPPHVQPYKVFDVEGLRVAVIGLANTTPTKPTTLYEFANDPLEILSETLEKVQEENPNVVVVLVHDALNDARHNNSSYVADIANRFADQVHVVLGGHAHQIVNEKINGVLFSECGTSLQYVSKITVDVADDTGKVSQSVSELIPLVISQTGEDEEIKALADSLLEPNIDEPLGETSDIIVKDPLEQGQLDSPLNDWVCDIMAQYTRADIVVNNSRGTRADLPKGTITERDLLEIMPYDDKIITMPVTGKFLQEFIKETFGMFTFAGLDIKYVQNSDGTYEIVSLKIKGKPIRPNKTYKLATNAFVAFGTKGDKEIGKFAEIPDNLKEEFGNLTLRNLMKENLKLHSPIQPPQTGRIQQVEQKPSKCLFHKIEKKVQRTLESDSLKNKTASYTFQ